MNILASSSVMDVEDAAWPAAGGGNKNSNTYEYQTNIPLLESLSATEKVTGCLGSL